MARDRTPQEIALSYVERVLSPGEQITYRAGLHWVLYLSALGPVGVALGATTLASVMPDGALRTSLLVAAAIALVSSLLQVVGVWTRIRNTEIVITDRRIIFKAGLISRRSIEMNLDKVESVVVDQGLLGRLLDYGTVVIRGVGAGLEPFRYLAQPIEFRRRVNPT